MCVSFVIRILFTVCLLLATALILIAAFAPWWRNFDAKEEGETALKGEDFSFGLLGVFCGHTSTSQDTNVKKECEKAFMDRPAQEKTMLICMVLALLFCILTFIWTIVYCIACCCERCLAPPLPILSGAGAICLSIGVVVYVVMTDQNPFTDVPDSWRKLNEKPTYGLSLWLTIGAIACLIADTILGIILVRIQKSPLGGLV